MEFLLLVVLAVVAFKLHSSSKDLRRRLETFEIGQAELRAEIARLRRHTGLEPLPQRPTATEPAPPEPAPQAAVEPVAPPPVEEPAPTPGPAAVPVVPAASPGTDIQLPPSSLEERLGTRWAVWVGGLALALGGLLLVRYSIEQGLIGPHLRIALGALLALVLAGAGEVMRRRDKDVGLPVEAAAHIPSVLTGAGTVVAFGTAYAAHALYEMIGPAPAFLLLGAIGIAAMLGAALHGPALAGLGLIGAFVAPALVSSPTPNPWPVVVYLAVVAAAAYGLARLRRWLWLAASVVAGVTVWGLLLLMTPGAEDVVLWVPAAMIHTLVQLALAAAFMGVEPSLGRREEDADPDWVAHAALGALSALTVIVLADGLPGNGTYVIHALVAIAILAAVAFLSLPVAGAILLAGGITLATMLLWPGLKEPVPPVPPFTREVGEVLRLPEYLQAFLLFAVLTPVVLALEAGWRLLNAGRVPVPTAALLAGGAALPPLLAWVLAYLRITQFDRSLHFGLGALLLALGFALAAERFLRAEGKDRPAALRLGTGALAAAAIAALALALTASLERGYLTVAFALAAFGAAYVSTLRDIPVLRYAVAGLGAIVLARVVWDPRIMGAGVGTTPVLNWLLLGYGVPAAAFALSARLLRMRGDDLAVRLSDGLAVLFTALLLSYQVRHAVYAGDVLHAGSSHVETGLQATVALGLSYVLARMDLARSNVVYRWASLALGVLAMLMALIGLGLVDNPLFNRVAVAGRVGFSSLTLAYLLPGVLAVMVARAARETRPQWYVTAVAALAVLLIFGFVSLEVRHAFQGEMIHWWRPTGGAERWAYSAAWLALGLLFLGYGILAHSPPARVASAALILLAVLKVFLLDLSGMTGLWRALSFIVLGVVLMGIGLVYQRLLFRPAPPRQSVPQASH